MEPLNQDLLSKLEAYEIDSPGVAFPFSARLARDNGWSPEFSRRVIGEYKRFAFLAMVAGHPVTPSDQVDQAWHLHLTYTRSYWEEFCGKILPRPLHHEPTKGGRGEGRKFDDWYGKTLESYRRFFAAEPPGDIWPEAAIRFGDDVHYVRVNQRRQWIIAKPRRALAALKLVPVAGIALALVGCTSAAALASFPFDLNGPEFLTFLGVFSMASFFVALTIRRSLRKPHRLPAGHNPDGIDPWSAALLAGGKLRAAGALIALLNRHGAIEVDDARGSIRRVHEPPAHVPPLAKELWTLLPSDKPAAYTTVSETASNQFVPLEGRLTDEGLLLRTADSAKARWLPFLLFAVVPLLGFIKICVGFVRDKPVGFLSLGTIASVLVLFALFGRSVRRSNAGDQLVSILKRRHADLESPTPKFQRVHSEVDFALPMAVALFGSGALANAGMVSLENSLRRNESGYPAGAGSPSGGDSSGCGDSDGGDGGCGGGD